MPHGVRTVWGTTVSGLAAWRRLTLWLRAGRAGGMPADVERQLAGLGRVIDSQATARIYAPLHETEPYRGVRIARDLSYGPDARNVLDVITPDGPDAPLRPVLMFVHGGGFFGGGRRSPEADSPFYDNVMLLAARNGLVGVNATYRLVPRHGWPAGAEDVAAAVRWVADTISDYGGDPAQIVLMGHSAGATHVATYLAHRQFHGPLGLAIRGAILISGLYHLDGRELFEGERSYFGADQAQHAARAPLPALAACPVPLMVVHAELDPPVFHDQARQLTEALAGAGHPARAVMLAKHSHISEVFALNTSDTSFSREVLSFVRGSGRPAERRPR